MEATTLEKQKQSFETLYEEHYAAVCAYVARRAGFQVAEDIAAEVFLVAWRRRDDVPADALPWLFSVASKILANHRRSAARGEALVSKLTGHALRPLEAPTHQIGSEPALEAALARLSMRELEALMLVYWDGLDGKRAARSLGCSSATFAARLYRARRKLRKELAGGRRPRGPARGARGVAEHAGSRPLDLKEIR